MTARHFVEIDKLALIYVGSTIKDLESLRKFWEKRKRTKLRHSLLELE